MTGALRIVIEKVRANAMRGDRPVGINITEF
jgi:hypothetical protein